MRCFALMFFLLVFQVTFGQDWICIPEDLACDDSENIYKTRFKESREKLFLWANVDTTFKIGSLTYRHNAVDRLEWKRLSCDFPLIRIEDNYGKVSNENISDSIAFEIMNVIDNARKEHKGNLIIELNDKKNIYKSTDSKYLLIHIGDYNLELFINGIITFDNKILKEDSRIEMLLRLLLLETGWAE